MGDLKFRTCICAIVVRASTKAEAWKKLLEARWQCETGLRDTATYSQPQLKLKHFNSKRALFNQQMLQVPPTSWVKPLAVGGKKLHQLLFSSFPALTDRWPVQMQVDEAGQERRKRKGKENRAHKRWMDLISKYRLVLLKMRKEVIDRQVWNETWNMQHVDSCTFGLDFDLRRSANLWKEEALLLWSSGAQPSYVNNASSLALQYHSARYSLHD